MIEDIIIPNSNGPELVTFLSSRFARSCPIQVAAQIEVGRA